MFAPSRSTHSHAVHPPHPSQSTASAELQALLAFWESENENPSFNVKSSLTRLVVRSIENCYLAIYIV